VFVTGSKVTLTLKRPLTQADGDGLKYLRVDVLRGDPAGGEIVQSLGINPKFSSRKKGQMRKVLSHQTLLGNTCDWVATFRSNPKVEHKLQNEVLPFAQWGVLGPLAAGFSGKKFTVMVEEEERGPFSVPVLIQVHWHNLWYTPDL
jgi:hypothetical protein